MTTLTIPATIDAARDVCGGLEGLAFATGWQRAAIVWAFTVRDAGHGGKPVESHRFSLTGFAALGLPGLTDKATVRKYYMGWQMAMDEGLVGPARPGEQVTVPDAPWPPVHHPAKDEAPVPDRPPAWKPTPSEQNRLVQMCADAYRRGYLIHTIAEAAGIHRSSVGKYVRRGGVVPARQNQHAREHEPAAPLVLPPWRDDEQPTTPAGGPPPPYQRSVTVAIAKATLGEYVTNNAVNVLAFEAERARAAGDDAWLTSALDAIAGLRAYLDQLRDVLVSADQRERAMRGWADQRHLRAVGDDE